MPADEYAADKGAEVVKRFGLPNPMKRVLPSALGATEEPLLDMTSAYSVFSNQGVRVKPHLIKRVTDADGDVKQEWQDESFKVLSPFVASQMRDMMRGVVTGGTAGSIMSNKELAKRMICGKTGTVNDFTDAWFIGYTPSYTAGVWIGYPGLKKSLGNKEAGSVAALPMWIQFMEKFLTGKPSDTFPKAPAPDRDIVARRAEAERAMKNADAGEAAAQSADDTSGKAKAASQDDPKPKDKPGKVVPRLVEPEGTVRQRRDERPYTDIDRPPPRRQNTPGPDDRGRDGANDKKRRGKNG